MRSIPQDAQIVLCHEGLSAMAGAMAPWAVSFSFKHFIDIPAFDKIVSALKSGADIVAEE